MTRLLRESAAARDRACSVGDLYTFLAAGPGRTWGSKGKRANSRAWRDPCLSRAKADSLPLLGNGAMRLVTSILLFLGVASGLSAAAAASVTTTVTLTGKLSTGYDA